jgi:hypothetical protein
MRQTIKKKSRRVIQTDIFNEGIAREIDKLTDPQKGFRKNAVFTVFKKEKDRQKFLDALTDLGYTNLRFSQFKGFDYQFVVCYCQQESLDRPSSKTLAKQVLYRLMANHFKAPSEIYSKEAQG